MMLLESSILTKHNEGIQTLDWQKVNKIDIQGNWIGYKCYAEGRAMHIKYDGEMAYILGVYFYKSGFLNIHDEEFVNKYKYNNTPTYAIKLYGL